MLRGGCLLDANRAHRLASGAMTRAGLWCASLMFPGLARSAAPPAAAAQRPDSVVTATVPAGARYRAGAVHRLLFGSHYRYLWTTPITVPILNLDTTAGGLTPLRRGGSTQTRALHFQGADGRRYVFRSVDKDPPAGIPPELSSTLVPRVLQDQVSAVHPAGALVTTELLRAAGVSVATPRLVLLPHVPAIAELGKGLAGQLGYFEERPDEVPGSEAGFDHYTRVIASDRLFTRLAQDPEERVDARAFLSARLIDLLVGDWDRHADQWRWGRRDRSGPWEPIPRDRDQALVKFDGFLLWLVRLSHPRFVRFGPRLSSIEGLGWTAHYLDGRASGRASVDRLGLGSPRAASADHRLGHRGRRVHDAAGASGAEWAGGQRHASVPARRVAIRGPSPLSHALPASQCTRERSA